MDVIFDDVPRRMTSATRLTEVEEDDVIVQLRNLKQVSCIQSYIEAFEELNSRAGIEEDQALSYFLSGLMDDFQRPVRMFRPKTLSEAYSLAKLQELTVRTLGVKAKGNQNNMQSSSSYYSSSKPVSVTATNKVGIMNNWNGGNKENEVDYSMKDNIRKLDSEMEEEKYADDEIDLQVEIDAFEEEEADWNHDIEKETECLPPARENAQMKELVEFEEADDAGSFFCHLAVDARAGEILDHGKVNGIELEQDTLKGNECISYARQNAQVNELYYSLSLPWLLHWFPRPMVKMKLELFLLWELLREADMWEVLRRKVTCQGAHAWSPNLPSLFENAASALATSGMDSRMLGGSNNIPDVKLKFMAQQVEDMDKKDNVHRVLAKAGKDRIYVVVLELLGWLCDGEYEVYALSKLQELTMTDVLWCDSDIQNAMTRELVVTLFVVKEVRLSVGNLKPKVKMKLRKSASRVSYEEETTDFGKSTGSSSVMKKEYQLGDIDWLVSIWFPKPTVKMKHERLGSGIREVGSMIPCGQGILRGRDCYDHNCRRKSPAVHT